MPTTLNGTTVLIGGVAAPLFYVSSGQINAQIPFALNGGNQYQVIVNANGALTTPQPINLTPAVPAILLYNSGIVVAQHGDGTDVTTVLAGGAGRSDFVLPLRSRRHRSGVSRAAPRRPLIRRPMF